MLLTVVGVVADTLGFSGIVLKWATHLLVSWACDVLLGWWEEWDAGKLVQKVVLILIAEEEGPNLDNEKLKLFSEKFYGLIFVDSDPGEPLNVELILRIFFLIVHGGKKAGSIVEQELDS